MLTLVIEIPSAIRMVERESWQNLLNYGAINVTGLLALTLAWRLKHRGVAFVAMLVAIAIVGFVYSAYLRILGLS